MPLTTQTIVLWNGDRMTWCVCGILRCYYFKLTSFLFVVLIQTIWCGRYGIVKWKNNIRMSFCHPIKLQPTAGALIQGYHQDSSKARQEEPWLCVNKGNSKKAAPTESQLPAMLLSDQYSAAGLSESFWSLSLGDFLQCDGEISTVFIYRKWRKKAQCFFLCQGYKQNKLNPSTLIHE